MPNTTNEVIINGQVVMSVRGDTVTENTLVQGETAHDKTGKEIEGKLDPVSHEELNELKEQVDALDEEAYKLSDEEGEISENDYIPFNDASDGNEPKKKTLFSSIIDKLKDIFAQKSDLKKHTFEVGTALPTSTIIDNYHADDYVGTYYIESDAIASGITTLPEDLSGKLIVANNGNGGFSQYYIPNDSVKLWVRLWWENAWSAWQDISSGGGDSKPHTYDKGTVIPANSDLDDYKTEGVYFVADTGTAETIDNIPVTGAGKLIVMDRDTGARIFQIYIASKDNIYIRDMNNDSVFSAWKNISRSHTYEVGIRINANSDLDDYITAGVYYIASNADAGTISNMPFNKAWSGKLIVMSNDSDARVNQLYITNYQTGELVYMYVRQIDSNGNAKPWREITGIHTYELGTAIPANSDLNNYTTVGVYNIEFDVTAKTIANIPVGNAGKLVVSVLRNTTNRRQMYYKYNSSAVYSRIYNNGWSNWECLTSGIQSNDVVLNNQNGSLWSQIKHRINGDKRLYLNFSLDGGSTWDGDKQIALITDISPSTVGNGYAVATVSGSAITATISGFQLRTGVIVTLKCNFGMPSNATLNISSTGAKQIMWWLDNGTRTVDNQSLSHTTITFMYDGTYYRIISVTNTPRLSIQDYVANTSGNIVVASGYDQNAFQTKFNIASNKLMWNYYKNSAWRGDVKIADYDDIRHQTVGITIPDNANLNDYTTNGIYNVDSNNKALTITNIPCGRAGKLVVERIAGSTYIVQTYYTYYAGYTEFDGVYRRSYTGSVWTTWLHDGLIYKDSSGNRTLALVGDTTTANDNFVGIKARIKDITTNGVYENNIVRVYQDHQTTPAGLSMVLGGGGNTFVGSGEAGVNHYNAYPTKTDENLFLTSDGDIILQANANTIANRLGFRLDANGNLIPCKADAKVDNQGNIGWSERKLAGIWTYKLNGTDVVDGDTSKFQLVGGLGIKQIIIPDNGGNYKFLKMCDVTTWYNSTTTGQRNQSFVGHIYSSREGSGYINPNRIVEIDMGVAYEKGTSVNINTLRLYTDNDLFRPVLLKEVLNGVTKYYLALRVGGSGRNALLVGRFFMNDIYASDFINEWVNYSGSSLPTGYTIEVEGKLKRKYTCYATCTTAGDQQIKVATIDDPSWQLLNGTIIGVKFSNTNTYSATADNKIQLNVNNTGARNIFYNTGYPTGTNTTVFGYAGRIQFYMYDGTNWCWISAGVEIDTTDHINSKGVVSAETGTTRPAVSGLTMKNAYNNGYPQIYGNVMTMRGAGDTELFQAWSATSGACEPIYFRSRRDVDSAEWSAWDMAYSKQFSNVFYCTCTTAGDQQIKVASTSVGHIRNLVAGIIVGVKFSNSNTYNATADNKIQLNVDGTGAKPIYYSSSFPTGTNTTIFGYANRIHFYMYDGTNWCWLSHGTDNDGNNRKAFYGTCSTGADVSAKVIAISDTNGWELRAGTVIGVKFTNSNTASNVTFNVNNSGAKSIYYNNAVYTSNSASICGYANRTTFYMYNGSQWVFLAQGVTNSDTFTSAYCSTAGGTAAKTATCSGYALLSKSQLHIIMTASNTAQSALTLNVNGKGAKPIYINGSASSASNYTLPAGSYLVYYNGTNYYFRTDGKITCAGTVTV